jgi:hypothetical protein
LGSSCCPKFNKTKEREMSEDGKMYLMILNDVGLEHFTKVMPMIKFLEVQGRWIGGTDGFRILVNPVPSD